MPRSMEIKNINKKPFIEILDDHKYIAEMKLADGDDIVQIGFPKKDSCDRDYYPVFVNNQEIFGTGTESFGQAIIWGETYLSRKEDPVETLMGKVRAISREANFLEFVLEKTKVSEM